MKRFFILSGVILAGCDHSPTQPTFYPCNLGIKPAEGMSCFLNAKWIEKTSLKGGLSDSSLYKVSDGKNFYVIRNIGHRNHLDKIREIQAQKIASEHGYGPVLHAYDIEHGKIVMSFLETSKKEVEPTSKAFKLAELVRKIHNGPSFCEHISIIEQIEVLFSKLKIYPIGVDLQKIRSLLNSIKTIKPLKKTATHRDLSPNNIIFNNGNFKVIDFENAGQDDPFFDIATVIIFNFRNTPQEAEFLSHYFGRSLTPQEQMHLNIMKKVASLFYGASILSTVPSQIVQQRIPTMKFSEAYDGFLKGDLSLENETHRLILAKSLLNLAIVNG